MTNSSGRSGRPSMKRKLIKIAFDRLGLMPVEVYAYLIANGYQPVQKP